MTKDVVDFINKLKKVFILLPEEELEIYDSLYYNSSAEDFIIWINRKYAELTKKEKSRNNEV